MTNQKSLKRRPVPTGVHAIDTPYKGYLFRSRLEARWAVFFDALKIRWRYEDEGFRLRDGRLYLPDFFLPDFDGILGMFVEVKPDGGDFSTAIQFSHDSKKPMWLAEGIPADRAWKYMTNDLEDSDCMVEVVGIPNADKAAGQDRMFWNPGYEKDDLTIPEDRLSFLGNQFRRSVVRARSARFEHFNTK